MTTIEAEQTLRTFNAWRRYGGPIGEGPDCPEPKEIGEAIDVAIAILSGINKQEKPDKKEKTKKPEKTYYYGG